MAEGDRATADIDDRAVQTEHLLRCARDHGERLVELPQRNVGLLDACSLESERDGEGGGGGEVDGCAGGVCIA